MKRIAALCKQRNDSSHRSALFSRMRKRINGDTYFTIGGVVASFVAVGNAAAASFAAYKRDAFWNDFPGPHGCVAVWCVGKGLVYGWGWPMSLIVMLGDLAPGRPFGRHWCPGAGLNGYDSAEMTAYTELGMIHPSYRDKLERQASLDFLD